MIQKEKKGEIREPVRLFVKMVFAAVAILLSVYNIFLLTLAATFPNEVEHSAFEKVWLWIFTVIPLGFAGYILAKKNTRSFTALLVVVGLYLLYTFPLFLWLLWLSP